jgi:hypothetical protein
MIEECFRYRKKLSIQQLGGGGGMRSVQIGYMKKNRTIGNAMSESDNNDEHDK